MKMKPFFTPALIATLLVWTLPGCGKPERRLRQTKPPTDFREDAPNQVGVGAAFELVIEVPGQDWLHADGVHGKVVWLEAHEGPGCVGRKLFPTYGEQLVNGVARFQNLTLTSPGTYSFHAYAEGLSPSCHEVAADPSIGANPGLDSSPRMARLRSGTASVVSGIASHLVVLNRPASGNLVGGLYVDVLSGAAALVGVPCRVSTTAPSANLAVGPTTDTQTTATGLPVYLTIGSTTPLGQYRATVTCQDAPPLEIHLSVL